MELNLGNSLIIVSILSTAASAALLVYGSLKNNEKLWYYSSYANKGAFASMLLAAVLLGYYFYKPNFNFFYVFSRVSLATPAIYRVTSLWIGQEGVFLVWALGMVLALLLFFEKNKNELKERFNRDIIIIASVATIFFLILAAMMSPFKSTMNALNKEAQSAGIELELALSGYESAGLYKDGNFINGRSSPSPSLLSPYMIAHPPLIFLGYALSFIPFAACLAYLFRNEGKWEEVSMSWYRASWVLLSASILLGSIWAYEELSFGGYWTWDPIETASLIPWVAITIFLHSTIEFKRSGRFGLLAPFFGVFSPLSLIYGTFITKSGLIQSSHQYARSAITPVLEAGILIVFAALVFFTAKKIRIKREKIEVYSKYFAILLSNIVMIGILAVLLWGITFPLYEKIAHAKDITVPREFYNLRSLPFVAATLVILGYCSLIGLVKKENLIKIALVVSAGSLLMYFLDIFKNVYLDLFIPAFALAAAGVAYRLKEKKSLAVYSLHLGIALIFLGVFASSTLDQRFSETLFFPSDTNAKKALGNSGYEIELRGINVVQEGDDNNWVQRVIVAFYKDGKESFTRELKAVNYPQQGLHSKADIKRGAIDIYTVFRGIFMSPDVHGGGEGEAMIPLEIKFIPLASLIWVGSLITIVSMLAILRKG